MSEKILAIELTYLNIIMFIDTHSYFKKSIHSNVIIESDSNRPKMIFQRHLSKRSTARLGHQKQN